MRATRRVTGVLAGVCLLAELTLAGPASAGTGGTESGIFCGAEVELRTSQLARIVDDQGRDTAAHNSGCFGISPSGQILWTPKSHPKWREMPGNGTAARVVSSYIGTACPPKDICLQQADPTIEVETSGGVRYAQTHYQYWGGTWARLP